MRIFLAIFFFQDFFFFWRPYFLCPHFFKIKQCLPLKIFIHDGFYRSKIILQETQMLRHAFDSMPLIESAVNTSAADVNSDMNAYVNFRERMAWEGISDTEAGYF